MITKEDKNEVKKIQKFLDSKDEWDWSLLLDKLVNNLEKAPKSYQPYFGNKFYTAGCDECGWWGSSELLDGGGQIADTGDYSDSFCPVCGNSDIVEKIYFGKDENGIPKNKI